MKVDFDQMRRCLTQEALALKEAIRGGDFDEIQEAFDELAQTINIILCISDDDVSGDFNELTDLRIQYFETERGGE